MPYRTNRKYIKNVTLCRTFNLLSIISDEYEKKDYYTTEQYYFSKGKEYNRVQQLVYVVYISTPNFIGIHMI